MRPFRLRWRVVPPIMAIQAAAIFGLSYIVPTDFPPLESHFVVERELVIVVKPLDGTRHDRPVATMTKENDI